jgi:two-component system cell cycle response regulator
MDWLVRLTYAVRRALFRGLPLALACGLGAAVVLDARSRLESPWPALALGLWTALLFSRCVAIVRSPARAAWSEIEMALLLAVGTYGLLGRADAQLASFLYPAVYVLVAAVAALARPLALGALLSFVVILEGSIHSVAPTRRAVLPLSVHAAFIATFALLNLVVLRVELARLRVRSGARLEAELARVRDAARSYRLLGAVRAEIEPAPARSGNEEKIARSSVEEIEGAVLFALDLLRRSLGLHTAVLLWLSESGTQARISELSTEADNVADGPFEAGDGIIGAVVMRSANVVLAGLKPGYKLPYYVGLCPVRHVCGVPVMDHGHARGVLLVDRADDRAFTEREEEMLASATRYLFRAVQNERVFVQLERAKVEQGKLYRAAQALGAALTEADVLDAGVRSAREVALFDFAAVTIFEQETKMHEVRAVSGEECEALIGARFAHNAGLVAMAVQNRHPLPYRGEFDAAHHLLFTKRLAAPPMRSTLVLPLLVHDRALGTLVLGAKRAGALGDAVRPTLEVLASHMAVSLANARMMKKLEDMAMTDGLTGLLNKRALCDMAEQKVAGAVRFARQLSVLVTDIDYFKKVNDAHGHDVGDVVIRGLGEILRRAKRANDVVARFGGEEFVVVCEDTDAKGAMLLAERIRKEVEASSFATPDGPLKVTCSIGIATFPEAGRDWETLFRTADSALYVSKSNGRNRCTAWSSQRKISAA